MQSYFIYVISPEIPKYSCLKKIFIVDMTTFNLTFVSIAKWPELFVCVSGRRRLKAGRLYARTTACMYVV